MEKILSFGYETMLDNKSGLWKCGHRMNGRVIRVRYFDSEKGAKISGGMWMHKAHKMQWQRDYFALVNGITLD